MKSTEIYKEELNKVIMDAYHAMAECSNRYPVAGRINGMNVYPVITYCKAHDGHCEDIVRAGKCVNKDVVTLYKIIGK